MKIIVAATPKSGNHWLKALLGYTYGLEQIDIEDSATLESIAQIPGDWIAHCHVYGTQQLLDDLGTAAIMPVSIVRHPCDVLVSNFFHPKVYPDQKNLFNYLTWDMALDGDRPGQHAWEYVEKYQFAKDLQYSLSFMRKEVPWVRYEDLVSDPITALEALTAKIRTVPRSNIIEAVARSEFSVMRASRVVARPGHLRKGKAGVWKDYLDSCFLDFLKNDPIYRNLFLDLGYGFQDFSIKYFDYKELPPFFDAGTFCNGVPITPFIKEVFYKTRGDLNADVTSVGEGSFYNWLVSPHPDYEMVTQLSVAVYQSRGDLKEVFPSLSQDDGRSLAEWALENAEGEYGLPINMFITDQFTRTQPWGT